MNTSRHSKANRPFRLRPATAGLFVFLGWALAACGSAPTTRYHTLMPAAGLLAPVPANPTVGWTLATVSVPAQVDQPQWLVRLSDDSMRLLEHERWVAPLADELQGAFGEALARRLGAPGLTPTTSGKRWRVRIEVQRFDSAPAQHVAIVVDWTLTATMAAPVAAGLPASLPTSMSGGPLEWRCRDAMRQAVAGGVPALAEAHRQAVVQIADRIAAALQAVDSGQPARCPGA